MPRWVPFANYEEFVVAANGLVSSSPQKFRNLSSGDLLVKYLLMDPNNGRVHIRFGKRGGQQYIESFIHPSALSNLPIPDATTDGAFPLWRLDKPVVIPPSQGLQMDLEDTTGAERKVNVTMIGQKLGPDGRPLSPARPFILADRVVVAASSSGYANLQGDQAVPVEVHALSLYLEETGSAANMRGLNVKVSGGGLKDWSDTRIPASLMFPHRNAVCSVHEFPGEGLRLRPTEGLQLELFDLSGLGDTVRVAMLGYGYDRRA